MSRRQSQHSVTPPAAARLHVVHVVLSLDVGGLERNVVNQVREGQKLGQRVSIVCLNHPGSLAPQVDAMGAVVVALGKRPGLRPRTVMQVRRVLRELAPDVVHTHQLATLLYGGAAARLLRVPVVVHTEHGREPYATRLKTRLLARVAGSFCNLFYCLTAEMAGEVRAANVVAARKIRVIKNGIDVSRFLEPPSDTEAVRRSLGIPLDAPVIGTVGRLTEVKRQDVLIRAFSRVLGQVPDAHLVLVGDGPMLAELRGLAATLGIVERVHFAGAQPSSAPFLHSMDVFALTSRSEGMPQAVLEASVVGVPVIASRVGGLPEVITDGETGLLFPSGDDTALASALVDLLGDESRRRRLGAAALSRVETTFSVARMASDYHRDFLAFLGAGTAAITHPAGAVAPRDNRTPALREVGAA
ncbi:MAG TPA: glycosyltransferase [Tepidisphaeraceae bacterium]|jgi:sugar transferase (PEP-CTERM/EpsH1 system associated)